MASSTIITDLTIHTAHIRLRSGKYMLVYYTNEYDEDGNPINITIYDSSETLIENPPYEIVYEVTKTIPPPEGDWLNNLWFKNGVNSLSPRQSPGQTDNIFLGFETAENFDLTDLVTYSGNYNFIAGYQLAPSLTIGSYNTIFGNGNHSLLSTGSHNFANGENNIQNSSDVQFSFTNGKNNLTNATSLNTSFSNGLNNAPNATDAIASFLNGNNNASASTGNVRYSFLNGFYNVQQASAFDMSFASGFYNGYSMTGALLNLFLAGQENLYSATSAVYTFAQGYRNAYNSTGSLNYNFFQGRENARSAVDIDFSTFIGYFNLYTSTSSAENVIALGRENGYSATGSHSNSIYLGYRNAYNGSGNYNNYQGYESGYHQTGSNNLAFGYRALYGQSGLSTGINNISLGNSAGESITTGNYNVFIGSNSGESLEGGIYNVFIGQLAGQNNISGNSNMFIGQSTGLYSLGSNNCLIGSQAGWYVTNNNVMIGWQSGLLNTGGNNTYIGYGSGRANIGSNNTYIGYEAGRSSGSSTGNVFLGYQSGLLETGSNKLYIENSNISTPLIYGEFDNDWIRINGYLEVRDKTGITTGNVVVWDGDKLVDSGSAIGSLGGDPDQTLTWTNTSTTVRNLTISGTGNTVELDGLAVEMALDDIVLNTSWRYQALDVNGVVLGAPLIIQEGTDINIVRSGNTLIFNSTAGGGDPDQTISYTESTKTLLLSGSFSSVQLDGLVDDTSWSGTSGTITYSLLDVDNTSVGDPLIFNAGTDMGIVRSGNTLTFSYTGSGASLWTDAGTYYRPNNLSNIASESFRIYDSGGVTIGGTSDPLSSLWQFSVTGTGRFTGGVSLNGNLEFTNSSNIVFDNTGSGNIVDTNGVSGTSSRLLGHDGGGVAWVLKSGINLSDFNNDIQHGYKMIRTSSDSTFALGTGYTTYNAYNSTQYDTGAMSGSTSTGIITVGAAGLYHITARVMISASSIATTDKIISCISINNDAPTASREDRVFINQPSDNGNMTINMSVTQSLSSSNTIRIKIGKVIGASGTYNVSGVSFDVFRIS